jgi:RHS repeat-associated protein
MIHLKNTTPSHPAFGSVMEGRSFVGDTGGWYRFGFGGQEKDDEIYGKGKTLDFGARIYDGRYGRWLSRDPLFKKYPGYSPYHYSANSPILFIDVQGEYFVIATDLSKREQRKIAKGIARFKAAYPAEFEILNSKDIEVRIYYSTKDLHAKNMDGITKSNMEGSPRIKPLTNVDFADPNSSRFGLIPNGDQQDERREKGIEGDMVTQPIPIPNEQSASMVEFCNYRIIIDKSYRMNYVEGQIATVLGHEFGHVLYKIIYKVDAAYFNYQKSKDDHNTDGPLGEEYAQGFEDMFKGRRANSMARKQFKLYKKGKSDMDIRTNGSNDDVIPIE